MNAASRQEFAEAWIANWNGRDLESILGHYAEDVVFRSPKINAVLGKPAAWGKDELRAYWSGALMRIQTLHFTLRHTAWDDARKELTIFYISRSDTGTLYACETMRFNPAGLIVEGIAYYSSQTEDTHKN